MRRSSRWSTRLISSMVVGVLSSLALGQAPAAPEDMDEAVGKAIEQGVQFLWSTQRADGSWAGQGEYSMGPTALAAYALLESGVSPQDERIAKTLAWLATHDDNKNYSVALRCQVWLIANAKTQNKYFKEFEADVTRMMKSAWQGAYTYDANGDGHRHGFDNSNAQFGVLGVWAGARANLECIDKDYWFAVIKHWISCQDMDGGWGYTTARPQSTASMTAAGVASVLVCMDNLLSEAFIKCEVAHRQEFKVAQRGLDWLDKNFEENIQNPACYYLYALERVGLASGYKYFGRSDWYKRGVPTLLRRQRGGAWGGLPDTCFALLFLIRGRNPVLFNKLEYNGDWNNRPRALASLTEWMTRKFEKTVNWQIITLKVPVSEWHDAPIVFLSGAKPPTFTDEELGKLREYVQQGGTLFSVTECGGSGFSKGIRDAYAKMFPLYELRPVEREHPLYTLQYPLRGKPRFHVLDNGVRPLIIHVDEDMVLPWQVKMSVTETWAFEAAANVVLYVTDKGALRARGVSPWPPDTAAPPASKVKLARLKYLGNWDPEPLAYERLSRLLAQEVGVGLEVAPIEIKDLPASAPAVASLTGTTLLQLSADDKQALKKFVAAGGTLVVDAAGGAKPFAESAEAAVQEIFGAGSLQRLPAAAALYQVPGKEIKEFKYRRQTRNRLANSKEPQLKAVTVQDRAAVLYSREDLTGGLVGYPAFSVDGYQPQTAYEIYRNIILQAPPAAPPAAAPAAQPAE